MPSIMELQAEVDLLKAQQARQTLALRQILESKLTGADGAAGTVVALEGGQTAINVTLPELCGG